MFVARSGQHRQPRRMRQHSRSLRSTFLRALSVPVAFMVGAVLTSMCAPQVLVFEAISPPSHTQPSGAAREEARKAQKAEEAREKLDALVALHGCWAGAAPADMADKYPGHAVVTWPGVDENGDPHDPTYGGSHAVDVALKHAFEKKYPTVQVHAFCR